MMKIIKDNDIFIFPEKEKINILVNNNDDEIFIDCIEQFFSKKKSGYCQIYDGAGNRMKSSDLDFIYIPSSVIEDNMELKRKSILNSEIVEFIKENEEKFQSIEMIRKALKNMLSDSGMYDVSRILGYGLERNVNIEIDELNLFDIVQMLKLTYEELSSSEKLMAIYNLLLYEERDKL